MGRSEEIRAQLLEKLREETIETIYNAWFAELRVFSIDEVLDIAYLGVPDLPGKDMNFIMSILRNRYSHKIENVLTNIMGRRFRVVIKRVEEYEDETDSLKHQIKESAASKHFYDNSFDPRYSFDNFVVGDGNKLAHAAAFAVAESPAQSYNPLYIYGNSGLGKTHLLHAIGLHLEKTKPEMSVLYVSAENFTNELVDAIRKNRTYDFKEKYRNVDVLLIDDIQFFGRTKESQEEFFHTFNDLYHNGSQIVISSDCEPDKIDNLQDRLKTRFQWNLIADIVPPDYETRIAILLKLSEANGLTVDEELMKVIQFISEIAKANVRELEGSLNRVVTFARLFNEKITLAFAQKTLGSSNVERRAGVTPERVKSVVSDFYHIEASDLESAKRQSNVAHARMIAMYLIREMTDSSLPKIGEYFGGKHHTTVLHACKKVENLTESSLEVECEIEEIKGLLGR